MQSILARRNWRKVSDSDGTAPGTDSSLASAGLSLGCESDAESAHPAQKPCQKFDSADAKTNALTRSGKCCTQTAVFVQIFLDNKFVRAQGERMTNEKAVRVALYSRVSTKDKGQDVRNQTDQLREFCSNSPW
jgi:hypothetical protein